MVKKRDLFKFVEGHRKANKFMRKEKEKFLSALTLGQSRTIYNSLSNFWEKNSSKEGMDRLEKQKIAFLVEKRKKFNVIPI